MSIFVGKNRDKYFNFPLHWETLCVVGFASAQDGEASEPWASPFLEKASQAPGELLHPNLNLCPPPPEISLEKWRSCLVLPACR